MSISTVNLEFSIDTRTMAIFIYLPAYCCHGRHFIVRLFRYDGKLSPGLKALGELPFAAWVQILAVIGIIELTVGKQDYENKVCRRRM